jgi:predicted dehydrogenase
MRGEYGELQFGWAWMQDAIHVAAGGFFKSDLASRSSPNWFLGVHFYDLVCFLTGGDPVEVRATGYRRVLAERGLRTYDAVKADFVFKDGAAVTVATSWNLPDAAPCVTRQGLYLQCAKGDIEIDSARRGFASTSESGYRFVNPMFLRATPRGCLGYGIESIGETLRVFHARARGARRAFPAAAHLASAGEALTATLMAEGVDRSLAAGRKEQYADVGAPIVLATIPGAE